MLGNAVLYVPAASQRKVEKGFTLDADTIFFDLEDAVGAGNKDAAREGLYEALKSHRRQNHCYAVRINGVETPWWQADAEMAASVDLDALVLPNANEAAVRALAAKLDALASPLKIIPLLETAEGIVTAAATLGASPRVAGAQFGGEDYTKSMGIQRTQEGDEIYFARCWLANVAHMYGIEVIDTPCTLLDDEEALRRDTRLARSIGYTGKAVIHPRHVDTVRRAFWPTEAEIARARAIVDTEAALPPEKRGDAFAFEGKMIDTPIVDNAKALLARARQYGLVE